MTKGELQHRQQMLKEYRADLGAENTRTELTNSRQSFDIRLHQSQERGSAVETAAEFM